MATEDLAVRLLMKADQYVRESRKAASATGDITKNAESATAKTQGLGKSMFSAGSLIKGAAVTGAFFALADGIGTAIDAGEEAAAIMANTRQIIAQTGGAANVTAEDVADLAGRLSALTGIEDDLVQEGANVLLTFKNVRNEVGEGNNVFDRTASLMLDVGAVMGTDATSGALQLGKALNDPVANMGALTRAGLTFSAQQKDQIKDMVANNDLLGAQKLILGELESQLGGTAAASAKASDKIGNVFGEMIEAGGTLLLPILEDVATELQSMVGLVDDLDRVAAHAGGLAESAEAFLTVVANETGGAGFLSGVGAAVEEFGYFITRGKDRMQDFRSTLEELVPRLSIEELRRARDGLVLMGEELGLTQSEITLVADVLDAQLRVALEQSTEATEGSADAMRRGRGAQRDFASETDDTTDVLGDQAAAFGDNERAIDRTIRMLGNYEDAQRRLTDPVFRAIDDQRNLTQALEDYTTAVEEFGPNSQPAIQAGFDLAEAQQAANESAQNAPEDVNAAKDSILLLGRQAGLSEYQLRLMETALNDIDGFSAEATVGVRIVGGRQLPGNPRFDIVARQHGGPVRAGQPAIVGEAGPELFVPNQSGTVIPNGAMGGGVTVAVYGNVYADDLEDRVVSAVEKARRRGVTV